MISYYSAVIVTALLLLGLLQYAVRNGNSSQKKLVFKVVGLTSGIAFLLPTLLNTLTVLQAGLLMAALAALAGFFVPVTDLLPAKAIMSEVEIPMEKKRIFEDEEPTVPGIETPEDLPVEQIPVSDEPLGETVHTEDATTYEEVVSEEYESEVEEVESEVEEVPFEPDVELMEEASEGIVLPDALSETLAEIMLMNGYLALQEDEEDEAVDSFMKVCKRAQVTDQRMMAYMELKLLLPETGRMMALIHLCDEMLEEDSELTTFQTAYIEKHTQYLKRLVSLLNAHGVPVELPYSAMPDELKEMAMTYQK